MAFGDIYRAAFGYNVYGQSNVNVMYFRQSQSGGGDDAQDCADVLSPILRDIYAPVIGSQRALITTVTTQLVARLSTDGGEAASSFPTDGASLGASLPPANAVIIRLRTGLAGRRKRGRIFLGGVPQNWVNAGVTNTAGATAYGAFMSAMLTNFGGQSPVTGYGLGVFSRAAYAILSNPFDEYFEYVTQMAQPPAVATMRSRKVGVGA